MKNRIVFLDYLRVIACFLVLLTHANEPLYYGGQGTAVASAGDAFWASPCVVILTALSTFLICLMVSWALGRIPKVGKFIVG